MEEDIEIFIKRIFMICNYTIGKIIIIIFMALCAFEDYKHKSVDLKIFIIMGFIEFIYYIYMLVLGINIMWNEILAGAAIGIAIYLIALFSKSIGEGDGLFFIISGAALGLNKNVSLFIISSILISCAGLYIAVKNFINNKNSAKKEIALLVFTFPAGLLILI